MFSSINFTVFAFTFRCMVQFELNGPLNVLFCIWCKVGIVQFFDYAYSIVSALFVEETILCPLNHLVPLLKISFWYVRGPLSGLSYSTDELKFKLK